MEEYIISLLTGVVAAGAVAAAYHVTFRSKCCSDNNVV